jgi:hypothetical protein
VAETLKRRLHYGLPTALHFWRANHGLEDALVVEQAYQQVLSWRELGVAA